MTAGQAYERVMGAIAQGFRPDNLRRKAEHIAAIEKTFCYSRFAESARYCCEQFQAVGLADVELIKLPADGRTAYMDFVMPQAWDAEDAGLEIVEPGAGPLPLIYYKAMPLSLANRCAPTPPEGIIAEVITAQQLQQMESAAGKLIYTGGQHPSELRHEVAAKGALGMISDSSPARDVAPDETYWINGWCSPGWYQTREHRPLVCFSISPTKGHLLREHLARGLVRVRARAQTRLYDGSIHTVTGLIPGKQPREIVLLAHIYEPFPADDAIGASALIEIGRTLTTLIAKGALPPLNLGIRLLIGMERYGFAHYFEQEEVRRRSLLGVSMDALSLSPEKMGAPIEARFSPASMPFWGDLLLWHMASRALEGRPLVAQWGNLSDDTFISDRTIGVPSQWLWTRVGPYHHSSAWFREEMNDWPLGAQIAQVIAGYVGAMASAGPDDVRQFRDLTVQGMVDEMLAQRRRWAEALGQGKLKAEDVRRQVEFFAEWQEGRLQSLGRMYPEADVAPLREEVEAAKKEALEALSLQYVPVEYVARSDVQGVARTLIPIRTTMGMPFSQARIPVAERIAGTHEQALNWADGRRNMLEIAQRVGWEAGALVGDEWLEQFMAYCRVMEKYGYIRLH